MRRAPLLLLALLALPLAGCSNPCQDLGDRLCSCTGGGTTADTCKQQVKNLLSDAGVHADDEAFCAARLASCNVPAEPAGVRFCEWINTDCGKVSCGMAFGDPAADPGVCHPAP